MVESSFDESMTDQDLQTAPMNQSTTEFNRYNFGSYQTQSSTSTLRDLPSHELLIRSVDSTLSSQITAEPDTHIGMPVTESL